jgi:hypothetical protein
MKVCEKVQAKGLTSYNEVADELVSNVIKLLLFPIDALDHRAHIPIEKARVR